MPGPALTQARSRTGALQGPAFNLNLNLARRPLAVTVGGGSKSRSPWHGRDRHGGTVVRITGMISLSCRNGDRNPGITESAGHDSDQ